MSKISNYRITSLHSFEDATKEPRQVAGLYFYQVLDCLVEFAYKISTDFRRRPELYRDLGDASIVATLAKLNAQYGTEVALPSAKQRAEIYGPVFGANANDSFPRLTAELIKACTAYAERVVNNSIEMLRENVRTACRPLKDYLSTLEGDSVRFSKDIILSELTEKICYPILRNSAVVAVFGIVKRSAVEYPYASDPTQDLLIEAISNQSKSAGTAIANVSRGRISNLQRTALRGTEAIATVIDFDEGGASSSDADLDLLISKCYIWGSALASVKTQSSATAIQGNGQQPASSNTQPTATASSRMGIGTLKRLPEISSETLYEHPLFKEWRHRFPLNMKKCSDCVAIALCGGGCPYASEVNADSVWEIDKRICPQAKYALEWMIWETYDRLEETSKSADSNWQEAPAVRASGNEAAQSHAANS